MDCLNFSFWCRYAGSQLVIPELEAIEEETDEELTSGEEDEADVSLCEYYYTTVITAIAKTGILFLLFSAEISLTQN